MKLKTGKQFFYLIFILLLHPLQAAAMFNNSSNPVPIQDNTNQYTEISRQPAIVQGMDQNQANQALNDCAGKSKQTYLMNVIKNLNWAGFEWTRLKDYLLHYMFPISHEVIVSEESQRYKVTFLEMTQGNDGEKIINNLVTQIVHYSKLKNHEAFFLVFNAILSHVERQKRQTHPNGKIIQYLETQNQNYQGNHYRSPQFEVMENEIKVETFENYLLRLKLMEDLVILNTPLVNKANILAQLFRSYSFISPPVQLMTSDKITVSAFINAYPSHEQSMVFMWLVGHRLDYELKVDGGFYQGEIRLRRMVKKRMQELHQMDILQVPLAIMSVNFFGFNYLTDDLVPVAAKVIPADTVAAKVIPADTIGGDLFSGYTLKEGVKACPTNIMKLRNVEGVFKWGKEIALRAGIDPDRIETIARYPLFFKDQGMKNLYWLLEIRDKYKNENKQIEMEETVLEMKKIFEEFQLHESLLKLRDVFYTYIG